AWAAGGRGVAAGVATNSAGRPDPREVALVWDVASGKELAHVPQHGDGAHVALSPDGSMLAVAARWKAEARVWEVASGRARFVFRHDGQITGLAVAPDGRTLPAASHEAPIYLGDVTGEQAGRAPAWDAADAERVWDDLASADAARAFAAMRRLRANPAAAVPLLRDKTKLPRPPDAATLKKLFADLA